LIAADAKPATTVGLALAITRAAAGDERVESLRVRPGNVLAVRLRGRITSCGLPRAALVVLG